MSIREELMLKILAKEESIVELAARYGVSRKTIYKWIRRYEKQGLGGLVDQSRRRLGRDVAGVWVCGPLRRATR